jgi:hypothetical protein
MFRTCLSALDQFFRAPGFFRSKNADSKSATKLSTPTKSRQSVHKIMHGVDLVVHSQIIQIVDSGVYVELSDSNCILLQGICLKRWTNIVGGR